MDSLCRTMLSASRLFPFVMSKTARGIREISFDSLIDILITIVRRSNWMTYLDDVEYEKTNASRCKYWDGERLSHPQPRGASWIRPLRSAFYSRRVWESYDS